MHYLVTCGERERTTAIAGDGHPGPSFLRKPESRLDLGFRRGADHAYGVIG